MEDKIINEMRKLRAMRHDSCREIEQIIRVVQKQEEKIEKMLPEGQTLK